MKKRVGLISVGVVVVMGLLLKFMVPMMGESNYIVDEITITASQVIAGKVAISVTEGTLGEDEQLNYILVERNGDAYDEIGSPFLSEEGKIKLAFAKTVSGESETYLIKIYKSSKYFVDGVDQTSPASIAVDDNNFDIETLTITLDSEGPVVTDSDSARLSVNRNEWLIGDETLTFKVNVQDAISGYTPDNTTLTIGGKNVTNLSYNTTTETLTGSIAVDQFIESDQAHGDIVFAGVTYTLSVEDELGNETVVSENVGITNKYYKIVVISQELKAVSRSATPKSDDQIANDNDKITYEIVTNEKVDITTTINNKSITLTETIEDGKYHYKGQINVDDLGDLAHGSIISVTNTIKANNSNITISDELTNTSFTTETFGAITYYEPITLEVTSFEVKDSHKKFLKKSDTLTLVITSNHTVTLNSTAGVNTIAGINADFKSENQTNTGTVFTAQVKVENDALNDVSDLTFNFEASDLSDQSASISESGLEEAQNIIFYEAIEVSDLVIKSNNTDTTIARNGDVVTVSFTTNHETSVRDSMIAGNNVNFTSDDDIHWSGSYTINKDSVLDTETVLFTFALDDEAGNTLENQGNTLTTFAVQYLADTYITDQSFESNTDANINTAKNGDEITLKFTSNHGMTITKALIAGRPITFTNEGQGMVWSGTYTVEAEYLEDLSTIDYEVIMSDDINGDIKTLTRRDIDKVIYYAPIVFDNIQIESDNTISTVMKNNEKAIVTFTTNHKVEITATIADAVVNFTSENGQGKVWTGSLEANKDLYIDLEDVTFNISASDLGENNKTINDEDERVTTNVKYYAPIIVSDIKIESDYSDPKVVRVGSDARVSFKTNHKTDVTAFTIGGTEVTPITEDGGLTWSAHILVQEGMMEDLSPLPFEFSLKDKAMNTDGPKTEADLPDEEKAIYQNKIEVTEYSFNAPGTDSKQSKNGDEVLLTFTTNHPMEVNPLTIAGQDVVATSLNNEGKVWTATLVMTDGLVEDQGQIPFSLVMTDKISGDTLVGNEENLSPVYYNAPLELSEIDFKSDNTNGLGYAINGNVLTLSFETNHPAIIETKEIAGQEVAIVSENQEGIKWSGSISVTNEIIADLADFLVDIKITDIGQNEIVTINNSDVRSIKYYAPITVDDVSFTNNASRSAVKNGDTVSVRFTANHPILVTKSNIGGSSSKTPKVVSGYEYAFSTNLALSSGNDQKSVSYEFSVTDVAGNRAVSKNGSGFTYYSSLALKPLVIFSSNDDDLVIKDGENIYIEVSANHAYSITSAKVNGATVTGYTMANVNGKSVVVIPVDKLSLSDQDKISCELSGNDEAGNTSTSISAPTNTIVYYAPLVVQDFSLVNEDSITKGLVKVGDKLTIEFSANHIVDVESASMAGDPIQFVRISGSDRYVASYTIKDTIADNTALEYKVTVGDRAGNNSVTYTNKQEENILYYDSIELMDIAISNTNVNSLVMKNRDIIVVSFTTAHPVKITSAVFSGSQVEPLDVNNDGMSWSFKYVIPEGKLVDQEDLSLTILIDDKAGNTQYELNQSKFQKIKYFEPIIISNTTFTSNNVNDGSKYVKSGDVITLTFKANHSLDIKALKILGQSVNVSVDEATNTYTSKLTMNATTLNDLATIGFSVSASDIARNSVVGIDQSILNGKQLTYYAPIASTTEIKANGENSGYVKNGESITITTKANHSVSAIRAIVNGKTLSTSGNGSSVISHNYTIDEEELGLVEGKLNYSLEYTDLAGNKFVFDNANVSENQSVIYDRTPPTVEILPLFEGFTNENLEFTILYKDDHLYGKGLSLVVNKEQLITNDDRVGFDGQVTYEKVFSLNDENIYTVLASVTDLAGNVCLKEVAANITIDKTNPEILATKIETVSTKRFKLGFVIADYYEIKESNLEEIICTVSDKSGTVDWDIDTPIETEGKKTIYLMAKDASGNVSQALTFDIFIDGTAPRINIEDSITRSMINQEVVEEQKFVSEMVLTIKLDQFGEELETFTELQLLDSSGNLVMDILDETTSENGVFQIPISEFKEYSLHAVAIDEVGNSTGVMEYEFELKDKSLVVKYYENKPVFYSTIPLLVIGFFASIMLFFKKFKKIKA